MVGQLLGWLMEIWYIVLIGLLSAFFNLESLREFASLLKDLEFALIPIVEVYTSTPINFFISNHKSDLHDGN